MILWTDVAPALITLFSSLALDAAVEPAFKAQWADKKREMVHPAVAKELILRVTIVEGIGQDERRYTEITVTPDEGDPYTDLREDIVGQRRVVLEVRVESHDHSEDETRWCWSMIERIRTRLNRQSSHDALLAVNVALVAIGRANDFAFTFDKRRVNAAVLDVTLAAAFTDEGDAPVGWIERIELTSHFQIGGVDVSAPPNVIDDIIPPLP